MADGKILYTLPLSSITPTVTGSDTGYTAGDAVDNDPNTIHRYTHDDQTFTWDAGDGETATVAAVSIHNHNLPSDTTVTYQNSTNNADWENDVVIAVVPGVDNFKMLGSSFNARYHRVTFSLLASQGIDIGELCLWQYSLTLSPNYSFRSPIINVGKYFSNEGYGKRNKTAISSGYGRRLIFQNWTAANCATMETIKNCGQICFVPDPDSNVCYHGIIEEESIEYDPLFNGNRNFSITFLENLLRA